MRVPRFFLTLGLVLALSTSASAVPGAKKIARKVHHHHVAHGQVEGVVVGLSRTTITVHVHHHHKNKAHHPAGLAVNKGKPGVHHAAAHHHLKHIQVTRSTKFKKKVQAGNGQSIKAAASPLEVRPGQHVMIATATSNHNEAKVVEILSSTHGAFKVHPKIKFKARHPGAKKT